MNRILKKVVRGLAAIPAAILILLFVLGDIIFEMMNRKNVIYHENYGDDEE